MGFMSWLNKLRSLIPKDEGLIYLMVCNFNSWYNTYTEKRGDVKMRKNMMTLSTQQIARNINRGRFSRRKSNFRKPIFLDSVSEEELKSMELYKAGKLEFVISEDVYKELGLA